MVHDAPNNATSSTITSSRPLPPVSRISAAVPAPVHSFSAHSEEDELWVEKYRPKSMEDMVGSAEYSRKLMYGHVNAVLCYWLLGSGCDGGRMFTFTNPSNHLSMPRYQHTLFYGCFTFS